MKAELCAACSAQLAGDERFCTGCGAAVPQKTETTDSKQTTLTKSSLSTSLENPQSQAPETSPRSDVTSTPVVPAKDPSQHVARPSGTSIASLILGIASLVFFWMPFIGLAPAIVALVLSSIGLTRKQEKKGFFITGLVTSIISTTFGLLMTFSFISFLATQ